MDYSLRELECFTAVAEELSFTRAARRLHLAQPPLSRHIRVLEEKIGARLFERTQRTVTLTAAGGVFYEETRHVLRQLTRAGEMARRSGQGETARLRLGFVSAVLSPELIDIVRGFRRDHPSVQIMLQDNPPAELLLALTRGTLDGGFVGLLPREQPPGIRFVPWRSEPLACFVPPDHRLARQRRVALRDLAAETFVAVSGEAAPAFAAHIRSLCGDAGFRPRIVLESPRAQAVAVMVAAGSGLALLPRSLARVLGDAVVALPLAQPATITHVFALKSGPAAGPMRDFLASFPSRAPMSERLL